MSKKKTFDTNKKNVVTKTGDEYLFGINPVIEAFRAKRRTIFELFVSSGKTQGKMNDIINLAHKAKVPVTKLNFSDLSKMAGTDSHQSVVARTSAYPFSDLTELMQNKDRGLILILDGIEDPQNLGALARTALCAGADGIIIPKDRAASPVPSASKSSAGALEHLRIAKVTNLTTAIKELKNNGFWIAGLDADADSPLYSTDLTAPLGIVIGGEDRGLRDLIKKNCDFIVSIPQKGRFNSLNASVAGALVIYEVLRQRENTV